MYIPMTNQSIRRLFVQRDLDVSAVAGTFEGHFPCSSTSLRELKGIASE